ncbi:DUF6884 domain-containing protein [Streptomyces prunicolor]|uniref:DUF6884 domain-containing protein n=1 Tax=Streptomyces prunicolor TaxID=67348 RepID=UPI00340BFFA0
METKTLHVPGQIRRHVIKNLDPQTQGERDLKAACVAGHKELEAQEMSTLNTIDLHVTNAAIGVALDIARGWLDSDNGNNVMAGKSMLKFELEYEPDSPREIRHAIKMPKSLSGHFAPQYGSPSPYKNESEVIEADMGRMSWTATGASGRVRAETLGLILRKMDRLKDHDHSAVKRAAQKFIDTYTEPYEKTQRLIAGYLEIEGQEHEPEKAELTAADFMDAIRGRGPEMQDDEPQEPKRLVVIACGGKKSERPGKIPADERYTGNYFTACLLAAEVMDGPTMVLSAKYGLIPLSEEIENYDVKLGDKGSVRLGFVRQQVENLGLEDAKVTVLGGERYVKAARQIWPDAEAPLKGGIGQQLKQLAGMYEGEALEDDQEAEEKAEAPYEWKSGELRNVMNLPGRYSSHTPVIWFGGKAGKRSPEPSKWMKVKIVYTGEGRYDLTDLETGEAVLTCTLITKIHWAPGIGKREFEEWRKSRSSEDKPAAVEEKPQGDYEVPANFLELAEEGNTDEAKAYWKRRCEEYRRTGK